MNEWAVRIVVLALIALVVGVVSLRDGGAPEGGVTDQETNLEQAPAFSYVDYEGNIVENTDFEGKALVVNSWAAWCPFCVDELPDFAALQKEFPDEVVVVAINRAESKERAKEFTDSVGVTDDMIFLLDVTDSYYRKIGGFTMPETLFVDKDGNIAVHKRGFMELDEMREHTKSALGI